MSRHQNRIAMALCIIAATLLLIVGLYAHAWTIAGIGLLGLLTCLLVWNWLGTSSPTLRRLQRRSTRHEGLASWPQMIRATSPVSFRRQATVLAPHTQTLPMWRRHNPWTVPIASLALPVGYIGHGWLKLRVRSSIEDSLLLVGGPRRGKSGSMATLIASAVGPVLITSTRQDLYRVTSPVRAERGTVAVFNPSAAVHPDEDGQTPLPTTVIFNPLTGCADPGTAIDRAADMINGTEMPGQHRGHDRQFWLELGTLALASLLHAAALHPGYTMRDVDRWVADPDGAGEVIRLLQRSPEPGTVRAANQFLNTNTRTRDGITSTIRPTLSWLLHPPAAAAAGLGPATGTFVVDDDGIAIGAPGLDELDVDDFLAHDGTIYMLGAHDVKTAPLVAAFAAEIARQARRVAGTLADERLDHNLLMALDEAALICPIPLHRWTADMGGRGITIAIAVQSRAQLRERYGDEGAATIITNAGCIVLYGGTKDSDDLAFWSKLVGQRTVMMAHYDQHGRYQGERPEWHPVLPAEVLSQLAEGRVVIIPRSGRPMICRAEMGWKRRDVRRARRRSLAAVAEAQPPIDRTAAHPAADPPRPNWTAAHDAAGPIQDRAGASTTTPPRQGDQDRSEEPAPTGPEPS